MTGGLILLASLVLSAIILGVSFWYANEIRRRYIKRAQEEANRILHEYKEKGKKKAEEYLKSAKEKIEEEKNKLKAEISKKTHEIKVMERNLNDMQEKLKKKEENLRRREKEIYNLEIQLKRREEIVSRAEEEITKKLEEIAKMTVEEARNELMRMVETKAKLEAAQLAIKIKEEAKQKAEEQAKEIIAMAIQRCAASRTAEVTTTIVELPSEEIKGRIIGREGRNIRAFEAITGVELIVDDTPEIVVLSSFDALRREKARIVLERLVQDGRIHPARIEEIAEKVEQEFDNYIRQIGEQVLVELGIPYMHPDLVYLIGKMKFRSSYGQNLLLHSIETAKLAGIMAAELGVSVEDAKRAGLLHDIGKVIENEEGPHALVGASVAKRYGEKEAVVNAIAAHHGDVEPQYLIAPIVAAADAISGARPGARRESIEQYIKRLQELESIAYRFPGVEKAYALYAGREVRVIVNAEKISDVEAYALVEEIARTIENEMQYPGQIKVVVIREVRAVGVAK